MDRDPTSVIDIDLAAIAHNLPTIRAGLGVGARLGVLYPGHGAGLGTARVAGTLEQAGADLLAVHSPVETERLLQARLRVPILNTMAGVEIAPGGTLYRGLVSGRLQLAVYGIEQLERLIGTARRFGTVIPVHLFVDAGGRLAGCPREDLSELVRMAEAAKLVRLVAVTAGPPDDGGAGDDVDRGGAESTVIDLAEAGAIPDGCLVPVRPRAGDDRPALAFVGPACWAGYPAPSTRAILGERTLQPAMRWMSRVIQLKPVEAGASVGYGARWTAARPTVVGLVPVGYATGYPTGIGAVDARPGSSRVRVLTADGPFEAPVVGTVSMDQMAIDLTADQSVCPLSASGSPPTADRGADSGWPAPEEGAEQSGCPFPSGRGVAIGTEVEVVGADPAGANFLTRLAEQAGRTPGEFLAAIHPEVMRRHAAVRTMDAEDRAGRDDDTADGARVRAATATMGRR